MTLSPRQAAVVLLALDHAYITGSQDCGEISLKGWDCGLRTAVATYGIGTDELHELRQHVLAMEREPLQRQEEECETCRGDGNVEAWEAGACPDEDGLDPYDLVTCPDCRGKGRVTT